MRLTRHALAALTMASLAGAVSAGQFGGPPGGMGRGGPDGPPPGETQGPRGPVMASGGHLLADLQEQLDGLRLKLNLRPDQEGAWQTYQERVGALMSDQLRPVPAASGNALGQIDHKIDVVRNRLTALEDIADAARRLYLQLDLEQRDIADRTLAATVPALYSGLGAQASADRDGPPGPPDGRGPPR